MLGEAELVEAAGLVEAELVDAAELVANLVEVEEAELVVNLVEVDEAPGATELVVAGLAVEEEAMVVLLEYDTMLDELVALVVVAGLVERVVEVRVVEVAVGQTHPPALLVIGGTVQVAWADQEIMEDGAGLSTRATALTKTGMTAPVAKLKVRWPRTLKMLPISPE